jgi:NADH-quinone oxidoreductase subunit A
VISRPDPSPRIATVYFELANVLVFTVFAAAFVVANLLLARLLRPKSTFEPGKVAIYECGEPTIGPAWIRFDIRFYTIALMFVVFDVEVALLFPWAVVFRDLVTSGWGWLAFAEAMTFIAILMAGLAYVWARGDIDWTPRVGERPNTTDRTSRLDQVAPLPRSRETVAAGAGAVGDESA